MAVPELSSQKPREKMSSESSKNEVLLGQETKLARGLAGNSKKIRDRALKSIKRWFENPVKLGEDDYMRLWQGLYYTLWMSDKPLVQEECSENIASLLQLRSVDSSFMFFKCGLTTLMNKWQGLDQLRLDKFLMFTRRFLRKMLLVLKKDVELVDKFSVVLEETILNMEKNPPMSLYFHVLEIFWEEIAKVFESDNGEVVLKFLRPFAKHLSYLTDDRQINHVKTHVFRHLFRQSDLGIEYNEKLRVWTKMGCPGRSVYDIEKVEESEEEVNEDSDAEEDEKEKLSNDEQSALDARAGHVNVVLPQLHFDPDAVISMLQQFQYSAWTKTKARKAIKKLIAEFELMSEGLYPLGMNAGRDQPKVTKEDIGDRQIIEEEYISRLTPTKSEALNPVTMPDLKDRVSPVLGTFKRNCGIWYVMPSKSRIEPTRPRKRRYESITDSDEPPTKMWKCEDLRPKKIRKKHTHVTVEITPKHIMSSPLFTKSFLIKKVKKPKERVIVETPKFNRRRDSGASPSKKVNINLNLNTSQDFDEHCSLVTNSPVIPWDASKKPKKSLLKPYIPSPINPFYTLSDSYR